MVEQELLQTLHQANNLHLDDSTTREEDEFVSSPQTLTHSAGVPREFSTRAYPGKHAQSLTEVLPSFPFVPELIGQGTQTLLPRRERVW
mmetsp:Transcript_27535/g.62485  ORF Transcript_27535/g.62485 Transcript_27535/m.62485 type:complete len:89 (-) Transcript_27535:956-1222(-)